MAGYYRRNIPALPPLHPDLAHLPSALGVFANSPLSPKILFSSHQELIKAQKLYEVGILSEEALTQRIERHAKIQAEHAAMPETTTSLKSVQQGLQNTLVLCKLDQMNQSLQNSQVLFKLDQMNRHMTQWFSQVDRRFIQVNERLAAVEQQVKNLEGARGNHENEE